MASMELIETMLTVSLLVFWIQLQFEIRQIYFCSFEGLIDEQYQVPGFLQLKKGQNSLKQGS